MSLMIISVSPKHWQCHLNTTSPSSTNKSVPVLKSLNLKSCHVASLLNSVAPEKTTEYHHQQDFWWELHIFLRLQNSFLIQVRLTNKLLKVENRNFSKCSSRDNKTCLNSFQRCCLFLYPAPFTAHLMAYLLRSFFISRLLCGLITTIALLWNSRIIMSFIVLIRVSVSPDRCYIFTVPSGKYMRAAPAPDRWSQTHCR